jgi:hypothetical protein
MDNILSTINYVLNLEICDFEDYVCDQWGDDSFTPHNKNMLDRALIDDEIDHMYKTAYKAAEEYAALNLKAKLGVMFSLNYNQSKTMEQ